MTTVREPAVAGTFYPNDAATLSALISTYLEGDAGLDCPKAIIAPHAGYIYSGAIAGEVYRKLASAHGRIKRVVLLGPSHRVAFKGMAVPLSTSFRTPLGDIPIDSESIQQIVGGASVVFLDEAHREEHSLEVHLPFLQHVLDDFTLVPIVVGDASKEAVATVLEKLWGGDETLIVISSDLSHFEAYNTANSIDANTSRKIMALDATLKGDEACGCRPVNGLLHYIKTHHIKTHRLAIKTVNVKNSGDTAGNKGRVVGYGAWHVTEEAKQNIDTWTLADKQTLLQLAREAIRSPLEGGKNFNTDLNLFPERLKKERATFVTLNMAGKLRGCIGSLQAHRPLVLDVAKNAQAAAYEDPRFSGLSHEEYQQIDIHISILSQPESLPASSLEDLAGKLRPGMDGLIIKEGSRQATYLPSVWQQIRDPRQFITELRAKAGLDSQDWQNTEVFTYTTEEFY